MHCDVCLQDLLWINLILPFHATDCTIHAALSSGFEKVLLLYISAPLFPQNTFAFIARPLKFHFTIISLQDCFSECIRFV